MKTYNNKNPNFIQDRKSKTVSFILACFLNLYKLSLSFDTFFFSENSSVIYQTRKIALYRYVMHPKQVITFLEMQTDKPIFT